MNGLQLAIEDFEIERIREITFTGSGCSGRGGMMSEIAGAILGLKSFGWDEKRINDFIVYEGMREDSSYIESMLDEADYQAEVDEKRLSHEEVFGYEK